MDFAQCVLKRPISKISIQVGDTKFGHSIFICRNIAFLSYKWAKILRHLATCSRRCALVSELDIVHDCGYYRKTSNKAQDGAIVTGSTSVCCSN